MCYLPCISAVADLSLSSEIEASNSIKINNLNLSRRHTTMHGDDELTHTDKTYTYQSAKMNQDV